MLNRLATETNTDFRFTQKINTMKYILIFRDLYTLEKKCHLYASKEEAQAWANKIDANRVIGIRELDEPVYV